MTRTKLFDAIRPFAPEQKFTDEDVRAIDQLADRFGLASPETPPGALKPSEAALSLIKSFEGLHKLRGDGKVEAYPDPGTGGDPWTIGWGSTGPGIKKGTVWTREMADARFEGDVNKFAAGVAHLVGKDTAQHEFDALVSFAYNVGLGALSKSTLLKKHNAGDKAGAAKEFGKWINAGGRPMKGLIRRREAEAKLYRGGT